MLQNDAMIVRLSISKWTARKFDKKITREVAQTHGVSDDIGRYNKVLIAKEAVQAIDKAATAARSYHYEHTLPWDDFGGRLLPSAQFMEYSKKMRELKSEFENAVADFVRNYPQYRDEAERRLNGMFNPADYPAPFEIDRKFNFSTDIEPVPSAEDFRVNVQKRDKERIQKEIAKSVDHRLQDATRDLYERLFTVVQRFAERLDDPEAKFKDTLVGNIVELTSLLPKLNVSNDPKLETLRNEVKSKLAKHEPDTLRSDAVARKGAAKDAKSILEKMNGYLGK